jgi:branched-chain amino acid transport system substrate-binding protein
MARDWPRRLFRNCRPRGGGRPASRWPKARAATPTKSRGHGAAPDAIFYAGYEIEAPYLRAELVEAGVTPPMLASDGAFLAATIDESNGAAEGMYVSAFAPSPRSVADAAWFEAYQAVEYRNPDTYSVNGYVGCRCWPKACARRIRWTRTRGRCLRSNAVSTLLQDLRFEQNGDLASRRSGSTRS